MDPRTTLYLFVTCTAMWICIGFGISYLTRHRTKQIDTTGYMVILCLFLGISLSFLLYNGYSTYALLIYILGVTASVTNLLNLSMWIMPIKSKHWQPQWIRQRALFYISPYAEQFFYMPILFFLIIPRLHPVSSVLQAVAYQFNDGSTPYVSLVDPVLALLFIMLNSWSNAVIRHQATRSTFRSLFKHSCLYTCLFIQLLLNENRNIFYHNSNVFRILMFRRPQNVSQLEYFSNMLLIIAIAIIIIDYFFSRVPKNWYANCVSILNLLCGLIGVYFLIFPPKAVISAHSLSLLTLSCVMMGQLFDLFDGRVAERWGSTQNGELFDDVADATSFGLVIGILIYDISRAMLSSVEGFNTYCTLVPLLLSALYIFCVIYRLVRFVVSKRAQKIKGGVYFFFGLPSPAMAALAGLACVLLEQSLAHTWTFLQVYNITEAAIKQLIFSFIIIVLCILTVSNIPYPHLGRVLYRRGVLPQSFRVSMEASFVVFAIYGIYYRTPVLILWWMGSLGTLYVLTPLYADKLGWYGKDVTVQEKHDETLFLAQKQKVERLERAYNKALAKLKRHSAQASSHSDDNDSFDKDTSPR